MAIRIKNLDLKTEGQKRAHVQSHGDITATVTRGVFVAPIACVVDSIDFYSRQGNVQSASNVSGINHLITVKEYANGSSVASRGNSGTSINVTDTVSANQQYRLTPTGNNSLTQGAALEMVWTICGTSVFSATIVVVNYTPLVHRANR